MLGTVKQSAAGDGTVNLLMGEELNFFFAEQMSWLMGLGELVSWW